MFWSFEHRISKSDQVIPSFLLYSSKQAHGKHERKGKWGVLQFRHSLKSDIQVGNIARWTKRMKQQRAQYSSAKPLLSGRNAGWYLGAFFQTRANITWCAFQKHSLHSGNQRWWCCACCLQGWRGVATLLSKMQDEMRQASLQSARGWMVQHGVCFPWPMLSEQVNRRTGSSLTLQRLPQNLFSENKCSGAHFCSRGRSFLRIKA